MPKEKPFTKTSNARAEILIVEDSPTQAEDLRYTLEQRGYGVSVAQNGREALEAVRKRRPTVIVSDIIMPEMDGFALCDRIKTEETLKDIPMILLTALSDPHDVLRGLECGADTFITKPYDGEYLLARIDHILVNAELRKEANEQRGVEIFFKGERFFITSQRRQILDLLLSTYETAVIKNRELKAVQEELETLNEHLEKKVEERTAALSAEIEERKKAEEEIKRLNRDLERRVAERTAQLEEANRDLESFSYSVSHDLKAPLRAIDGFSAILTEEHTAELDGECNKLLGLVRNSAQKMARLIDDMLAFSRAGRRELELSGISMEKLAHEVIEELGHMAEGRKVRFEVGKLPPAVGDQSAVRQIFTNLLSNALKFTKPKEEAVIVIDGLESGDENIYSVRDNGVGFDPLYASKLFSVFQRLHGDKEFEGTGIGLAIVKRFVNKLGGRVWAEGKIDEGATFYFTLPRKGP